MGTFDIHPFGLIDWGDFIPGPKSESPKDLLYTDPVSGMPMIKVEVENFHFWKRIDTKENGDRVVLLSRTQFPGATEVDLRPRASTFQISD